MKNPLTVLPIIGYRLKWTINIESVILPIFLVLMVLLVDREERLMSKLKTKFLLKSYHLMKNETKSQKIKYKWYDS